MKKVLKVLLYIFLTFIVLLIIVGIIIAINLYREGKKYKNGDLYLIYSSDGLDITKIVTYDQNTLKKQGSKYFRFSGIELFGSNNEAFEGDILYLLPRGDFVNRDYDKLVGINSNGKIVDQYTFETLASPTDYVMNDDYIVAFNNLNFEFFIRRIDRKTKELKVMEAEEGVVFTHGLTICNNETYGLGSIEIDEQTDIDYLYHFDFDNNKIEKLVEIGNDDKISQTIACYNNSIYYTDDTKLYAYDIDSGKVNDVLVLDKNNPLILYIKNNTMYLAHSDYESKDFRNKFDIISLDSSKEKESIDVNGQILQVMLDNNNNLWYCLYDENDDFYIKQYDIENHKELQSLKVDQNNTLLFAGFAIR